MKLILGLRKGTTLCDTKPAVKGETGVEEKYSDDSETGVVTRKLFVHRRTEFVNVNDKRNEFYEKKVYRRSEYWSKISQNKGL